jgi:hypothetical protein
LRGNSRQREGILKKRGRCRSHKHRGNYKPATVEKREKKFVVIEKRRSRRVKREATRGKGI